MSIKVVNGPGHKALHCKHSSVAVGKKKSKIKIIVSLFFPYPLHFTGIIGEMVGESSCVVPDVIKPANILTEHGPEQQTTHTRRQILTRYCERDILKSQNNNDNDKEE